MAITTIVSEWYSENRWLALMPGSTKRMISVSSGVDADALRGEARVVQGPTASVSRAIRDAVERLEELWATCFVMACKDAWRLLLVCIAFGYYINTFGPHLFAGNFLFCRHMGLMNCNSTAEQCFAAQIF
ncbi:MAG: hypothetical protein PHS55_06755 [Firmicutes bacterium]|nr:hypothetical protein [Bacillota bacterium]